MDKLRAIGYKKEFTSLEEGVKDQAFPAAWEAAADSRRTRL